MLSASAIAGLLLVGRILYGGFFLISGLNHFMKFSSYKPYVASKGVPAPALAVVFSGLLIFLGGLSVLLGCWPDIGLLLIAIFLVFATPPMHSFWKVTDPMARMNELVNFEKNVALLGAALMLAAISQPWPISLGH
ncbi:MAG: DoxX family protein [Acidobacteriota bacterium]|nr:DoxX family protein [Acidobacteriota bacterium]MDE3169262.1 DoxX family protein [Acidobacteriota bacterium]